jgi:hypothetical protein
VVLFGGTISRGPNDPDTTWDWNGSAWNYAS